MMEDDLNWGGKRSDRQEVREERVFAVLQVSMGQ